MKKSALTIAVLSAFMSNVSANSLMDDMSQNNIEANEASNNSAEEKSFLTLSDEKEQSQNHDPLLFGDDYYHEILETDDSAGSTSGHFNPRTRFLTGIEYEQIQLRNQPNNTEELLHYIYADGFTRISDQWSIGYVLKEIHHSMDGESTGISNYTEFLPYFYHRFNPTVAFNVMGSYEKTIGVWQYDKYMVKPGVDLSVGKHFLHLSAEFGYRNDHHANDKGMFMESEPLYVYRISPNIGIGAKFIYVEEFTDFNWFELAIKPLIQFNFDNGNYLELRYERGRLEMGAGDRDQFDYNIYALYADLPISKHFSFLADIQIKDRNEDPSPWTGDVDIWFSKIGIVSKF